MTTIAYAPAIGPFATSMVYVDGIAWGRIRTQGNSRFQVICDNGHVFKNAKGWATNCRTTTSRAKAKKIIREYFA
jgi:hypothetical protein